jgi:Zn-dependent peptidase ImmA (M78 family)/transcriptional regulator with XRE-family HTH domain
MAVSFERLGDVLRNTRERLGLSQQAAAEAAGLNRVVLNYYETGARQPSLSNLASLARTYGVPVTDLLEGLEPQLAVEPSEVLFRASSAELPEGSRLGIHRFSGLVRTFAELAHDLKVGLPGKQQSSLLPPVPPRTGRIEAVRLARVARERLGLGHGPLGDAFHVLDDQALIFRVALGPDLNSTPSGLFYNHPEVGFCVVVNSDMTFGRQVFTLVHELCHGWFHSHERDFWISFVGSTAARERSCDAFTGEFLVPSDGLAHAVRELEETGEGIDPISAVHLQRYFGVSYATILVRLRQEGLISPDQYENLSGVSSSKLALSLGYEVHPADLGDYDLPPLERLPAQMLRLLARAVREGTITRGDAAESLGLSLEEALILTQQPRADDQDRAAVVDMERAVRIER